MQRRSFLKASAALAATPLIPSISLGATPNTSLVKNGSVITAAHWGILKATIENGKVVKSEPWQKTSSIHNALQYTVPELIYSTRIKAPMVRKSYLDNPDAPKPELRGKDEWVEVSYEDAIKLVAKELKKTREKKGPNSVFAGSYGWRSAGNANVSITLLYRFMNVSGGFVGIKGDYSTGAAQVILPHVVGSGQVYEQQTTWPVVLENSKVVVLWGCNPVSTLRLSYTASDEQGFAYLEKLRDSGKEIIIIDPLISQTSKFFGKKAKQIRPVPNTDVAMMLGMAHYLYTSGKYDKEFLNNYTTGFDKFLPYLLGTNDNTPKTPEWAAKICGINAKTIKSLAQKFYDNRTMIMAGWGMQRAHHGEQPHWMIVTLCSMLGQIGLPGGGFGFSYHYANGGAPTCVGGVIGGMNSASKGVIKNGKFVGFAQAKKSNAAQAWMDDSSDISIPLARVADMILNPGKTIDYNGTKITYPEIDFIYWVGGNPLVHHQDTNTNVRAWRKPRTIVVNELYWTPTAKMADIVFPATTPYERNDITMTGDYSNAHIVPMKQLVEPQNGAKDDYQIFTDLCHAYADGLAEVYTDGGKKQMDWVKEFYESAAKSVNAISDTTGVSMPSFEEWWSKNEPTTFTPNMENEAYVTYAAFREDPILNALGTPSGLIEIYSETIAKMGYKDCGAHPMWFEPVEWLGMKNKPARFHLLCTHPHDRLHSQQNNCESLRNQYAINNREPIIINKKDAKELGIKNGDLVRVFNARGQILGGAVVSNDTPRNVVRMYEGAWYDPNENGLCKNGNVNCLTIDIPTSELAVGNISQTVLVNIEKYKGDQGDITLTAFLPPKGAK